jgi:outer membrane protein OmpA-like peptidoglycan-associated protein
MTNRFKYIVFIWAISALELCAQEPLSTKSKKAIEYYLSSDNFRVRGQLDQAIGLLNKAVAKDPKFEEAYFRLGLTYRSAGKLELSTSNFEKGLVLTKDVRKQKNYAYVLGETYLRNGKYNQSADHLNRFLTAEKLDKAKIEQAKVWNSQCDYASEHKAEKLSYHIKVLSDTVNAYPMQYFPTITADEEELIFTIRFGSDHDDNEDIVVSRKDSKGSWSKPVSLSNQINSNYREGASTISADGRKIIFTICGPKGCDLFESNKVGYSWSKPASLGAGVNTGGWEAQPSLSADGNELYFVSDRKGGMGGYDIWYSKKTDRGIWRKAVNIGKPVNTPFDEIAPFVHVNNQNLYYASNGLPGFGSYDIYVAEKTNGIWEAPVNMGAPLNDFEDQYSLSVTSDGQTAYYSKEESRNKSKIYVTPIPKEFRVSRKGNVVSGYITDAITKSPLSTGIELRDLHSNMIISNVQSDSITGQYLVVIPGKAEYGLFVTRNGYLFNSQHFNYEQADAEKPFVLNIELQPIRKNATITLNNIFFAFDKSDLEEKSKVELQEILDLLNKNPILKVKIEGHTDNAGTETYNKQLSLSRANSVVKFLTDQGVSKDRVLAEGMGSKNPLKPNNSDENRQFNRRIEVKIIN